MQFLTNMAVNFFSRGNTGNRNTIPGVNQLPHRTSAPGFTLIELIIVIVLLGIIGVAGSQFISSAFLGFSETETRTQIYEEGKTALVRLEREIHLALPNAVDVSASGDTISFGMIDETAMRGIFGRYTENNPTNTASITDYTAGLPQNSVISIYNTNWTQFSSGSRLYRITSNNANPMTLDGNIQASSPYQRFFAVRNKAVQYKVSANVLYRFSAGVATSGTGSFITPKPLVKNIYQTGSLPYFSYSAGSSTKNGSVTIHFTMKLKDESINFDKDIHICNVP